MTSAAARALRRICAARRPASGYLVTVPTDACATLSAERHEWSLRNNRGYCRQITTRDLLREIARLTGTE